MESAPPAREDGGAQLRQGARAAAAVGGEAGKPGEKEELRVDPSDGCAYSYDSFREVYGA